MYLLQYWYSWTWGTFLGCTWSSGGKEKGSYPDQFCRDTRWTVFMWWSDQKPCSLCLFILSDGRVTEYNECWHSVSSLSTVMCSSRLWCIVGYTVVFLTYYLVSLVFLLNATLHRDTGLSWKFNFNCYNNFMSWDESVWYERCKFINEPQRFVKYNKV